MTIERSSWVDHVGGAGVLERLEVHVVPVLAVGDAADLEPQRQLLGSSSSARTRRTFCRALSVTFRIGFGSAVLVTHSSHTISSPLRGRSEVRSGRTLDAMIPGWPECCSCCHRDVQGPRLPGRRRPPRRRGGRRVGDRQTMAATMGDRALSIDLDDPSRPPTRSRARRPPPRRRRGRRRPGGDVAALAGEALGLPANPPRRRHPGQGGDARRPGRRGGAGVSDCASRRSGWSAGRQRRGRRHRGRHPCVVKPMSLSASRGVIRADDRPERRRRRRRIRAILDEACRPGRAPMLVEAFVPGDEVAVEGTAARRRARGPGRLRQARPARRAVLRGDDLRHAVPPPGEPSRRARRDRWPRRRRRSASGGPGARRGSGFPGRPARGSSSWRPARSAGCAPGRCASAPARPSRR